MYITSQQTKERFIKDNSLPIQAINSDVYFQYMLELLDPYYGCIKKYQLLLDTIKVIGEQELINATIQFRNEMVNFIETCGSYKHFSKDMDMPEPVTTLNNHNLYQKMNANMSFASIDLIEANYQSLKYCCPGIFTDHNVSEYTTYCDFAKMFTNIEYIIQSKKIRQVLFGLLSPSRQQCIQRFIMSMIKQYLLSQPNVKGTDFVTTSSDEIIFETSKSQDEVRSLLTKDNISCIVPGLENIRLRINTFDLEIHGTKKYEFFVKSYKDGKKEIKQVDSSYIAEVIKFLEKKDVNNDFDCLFIKDGRLCKFQEALF